MAIALLHYSYTHKDGRCLVIAPMKSHVELIYQEIVKLASKNEIVMNSITRKVTSPQFMIQFSNGSTIRFFTSGMRSGRKVRRSPWSRSTRNCFRRNGLHARR